MFFFLRSEELSKRRLFSRWHDSKDRPQKNKREENYCKATEDEKEKVEETKKKIGTAMQSGCTYTSPLPPSIIRHATPPPSTHLADSGQTKAKKEEKVWSPVPRTWSRRLCLSLKLPLRSRKAREKNVEQARVFSFQQRERKTNDEEEDSGHEENSDHNHRRSLSLAFARDQERGKESDKKKKEERGKLAKEKKERAEEAKKERKKEEETEGEWLEDALSSKVFVGPEAHDVSLRVLALELLLVFECLQRKKKPRNKHLSSSLPLFPFPSSLRLSIHRQESAKKTHVKKDDARRRRRTDRPVISTSKIHTCLSRYQSRSVYVRDVWIEGETARQRCFSSQALRLSKSILLSFCVRVREREREEREREEASKLLLP